MFVVGMKCDIFENLSTTTNIAVKSFDFGNDMIKSIDMSFQGVCAIGNGIVIPYGFSCRGFDFWHSGHVLMYSCISRRKCVLTYRFDMNDSSLFMP